MDGDRKSQVTTSRGEEETFMDLSAISCSLMLEQQQQQQQTMTNSNRYLCPQQPPPPPYPSGLVAPTPYQTPYVSPYATPFHTPSPSPLSSVQSSPANRTSVFSPNGPGIKGNLAQQQQQQQQQQPGIDSELAMILECDPFIWDQQHQPAQAPPPPYPQDRVTGRPPHPRQSQQQPSRTQLKQQLQRQQLEQQERREREKASTAATLHKSCRASSCPSGNANPPISNNIPIVPVIDASVVSSLPPQVLKVRTRLESNIFREKYVIFHLKFKFKISYFADPTLYHVMESRKRQVRQFLQDTMQLDHQQQQQLESLPSIHSSTANSAPAGGFTADTTTATQQHHHQAEVLYCTAPVTHQ